MNVTTYKNRMNKIIHEEKKVYRKVLATKFGIAPCNVNRDTYKLIAENEIGQDRDGKGVYYFPIITIPEAEPAIQEDAEAQESRIRSKEDAKLFRQRRVTKADQMYEYVKKKGCEVSNRELIREFNIPERKLSAYIKPKMASGELKWRKIGKETFYYLGDSPIDQGTHLTKLEMFTIQIEELEDFRDFLKNQRKSRRTIIEYVRIIIDFYNFKNHFSTTGKFIYKTHQLTTKDFNDFERSCEEKGLGRAAIAHTITALKTYFKYLKNHNKVSVNIMEDILIPKKEPQKKRDITIDDWWAAVNAVKNDKYKLRSLTLLLVMLDTGVRVGELETICREHIEPGKGQITILGEKDKGQSGERTPRTIPLSKLTLQYLKQLIQLYQRMNINEKAFYYIHDKKTDAGTAVFLNDYRKFMKDENIAKFMRNISEEIGKKITVHSFRHLISVILANGGMREDLLSTHLGQIPKNMSKTTWDYMRSTPDYQAEHDRQYQRAHPLNQAEFIQKFNTVIAEKEETA